MGHEVETKEAVGVGVSSLTGTPTRFDPRPFCSSGGPLHDFPAHLAHARVPPSASLHQWVTSSSPQRLILWFFMSHWGVHRLLENRMEFFFNPALSVPVLVPDTKEVLHEYLTREHLNE